MIEVVNGVADSGGSVVLYGRDPGGQLVKHRARGEHAFFLRASDVTDAVRRGLRGEYGASFDEKEPGWVRVACRDAMVRREMVGRYELGGLQTFEGDVSPVKRLMADRADLAVARPRRCYLDLETDSRVPFSRMVEMRILVWCVVDDAGNMEAGVLDDDSDADERALLKQLFVALEPYDQVLAWNGDRFDFEVLKARVKRARLDVGYLRRWLWLDQLACFKRMNMHGAESGEEKQSYSLQNIAMSVLGLGEGKHDFDASKTYEAWAAGGKERDRLVDYCVRDTELLPKLEAKRSYADLHTVVCQTCNVFPDSWALMPTSFVDGFMFKLGRETRQHFRTKLDREAEPQFAGAYVMEPKTNGIVRDVHVVDFASLYPSIVLTFNMSPETKAQIPVNGLVQEGHCRAPKTGTGFRLDPQGLLARAIGEVMRQRKEWKRRQQEAQAGSDEERRAEQVISALKIVNNSFFGVAASQGSRYGDRSIGEAITQTGVWAIGKVVEEAGARAYEVIAVDTDGAMITGASDDGMREFARDVNQRVLPPLLAAMGCRENYLELDYQQKFSRLIYVASKKYVAQVASKKGKVWHPKMRPEIKGLEYVRGDSLKLARDLQGEVVDLLCAGMGLARVPVPTDDPAHYEECVERHKRHVLDDELGVDEVKVSKTLNRELGDYAKKKKLDGTDALQPIQVRIGEMLKARGMEAREGTKVDYVVVDGHSEPKNIIPAMDYDGKVDRAYLWNHLVWPATERLLDAAYPGGGWKRHRVQVERAQRGGRKPVDSAQSGLFDLRGMMGSKEPHANPETTQ